jgi:ATP-binding cassette subfamily B protein
MPDQPTPRYRETLWRLLGFLRPYKLSLALSLALAVVAQLCALSFPWLTGAVVGAIEDGDRSLLPWLVAAVVALGIAKALATGGRRLISGWQALGVDFDLRDALYAKLLRLSFGWFDRQQTGQLMSRATVDVQSVRFFLGYGLIFFFQHVFTVVGVTVLVFVLSWKLALVALAFAPFTVAIAYRYSSVSHPVLRDVQQRMADVATAAEENVVGVHVVKSFAQEQAEQDKFERRSGALFAQSVRANRQRAFYVPVLAFLPMLGQAAVLLVGGTMVVDGTLTLPEFVAFNLYLAMLVFPLRMLGMWIGEGQRATASGERIFQVID